MGRSDWITVLNPGTCPGFRSQRQIADVRGYGLLPGLGSTLLYHPCLPLQLMPPNWAKNSPASRVEWLKAWPREVRWRSKPKRSKVSAGTLVSAGLCHTLSLSLRRATTNRKKGGWNPQRLGYRKFHGKTTCNETLSNPPPPRREIDASRQRILPNVKIWLP